MLGQLTGLNDLDVGRTTVTCTGLRTLLHLTPLSATLRQLNISGCPACDSDSGSDDVKSKKSSDSSSSDHVNEHVCETVVTGSSGEGSELQRIKREYLSVNVIDDDPEEPGIFAEVGEDRVLAL